MTAHRSVKGSQPRIVGVVRSLANLRLALQMRKPPDLFELRLDCLIGVVNQVEHKISSLSAPIIITARHPSEGGANNLSLRRRRELLMRFLPLAHFVDVELRSARALRSVLKMARKKNVGIIISFHDFNSMPDLRSLRAIMRQAKICSPTIFKIALRTDTPDQLTDLLDFVEDLDVDVPISAMGIGKLGRVARLELARRGSVLVYASLGQASIPGQMPIRQLRSALSRFRNRRRS